MAAGKWKVYDSAKEYIGDGTIDLDNDVFKIALFSSASNANTLTNSTFASLTNELSGNGYTSGGNTLSNVTWTRSSSTTTFDADNSEFLASGGSLVARYAVIYDDTAINDPIVCVCLLDVTPADVTAPDGTKIKVNFSNSGIFSISGATSD